MNIQNFINRHLYKKSFLSFLLLPLAFIYSLLLILRRFIYHNFAFLRHKSSIPLICIGNISSGGTGKTPFTIYLVKTLQKKAYNVAVISRGYKGAYENQNMLISDFNQVYENASIAGDEPLLMTKHLANTPIMVGRDRIQSLRLLEKKFPHLDYIVLDDAFQYLKLTYFKTILIFNGISPLGNGFTLPAGILREPLINALYADYFVYNGYSEIPYSLLFFKKPVFRVNYYVQAFVDKNQNTYKIDDLTTKRLALLSAIGVPESFEKTVINCGLNFTKHFIYPDHYNYQDTSELKALSLKIKELNIDFVLTTEKDYVKLNNTINDLPILVLISEFKLEDSSRLFLELEF